MAALDDAIDQLYLGPLDAFTDARNLLAKTHKRPDLKTLEKPSLPAWVVNQLHWHHRPVLARVEDAAAALLAQHQQLLAGKTAAIAKAEQAHREAVRAALATAREVLRAGGHPESAATLDAVRNTLQALPSPEAQGRLTRPLTPRGLEALAGLVPAARSAAAPAPVAPVSEPAAGAGHDGDGAATRRREAARFTAKADADRARKDAQAEAKRREDEAREEREREARRAAAEAAVADAESRVAAAEQTVATARAAVTAADRAFADAMAARDAAKAALADARKAAAAERE